MKEEILVKLRSAEEQNAKRVAAAKDRANEILRQARAEAQSRLEVAKEEVRRLEDERVAAERKKLEAERQQILSQGRAKEEALRAAYQKRADQHVERALQTFERSL